MGSPYQQKAFQRKLIYLGAILALLAGSWMWRHYLVAAQAESLALREESRGDADLVGAATRLSLTGMRGLATCFLWYTAMDRQKKNQWNELELIARSLTKLQPHFIAPWLFQGWNLAYNVSVEADAVNDRYFYISRGIALLGEGERQNHHQPRLRYELGFTYHHKIGMADDTNALRSIFQLSLIPPSERDPERFNTEVFSWNDFSVYCKSHPEQAPKSFNWATLDRLKKDDPRWFTQDHPWKEIESFCSTHQLISDWQEMDRLCQTGHLVRKAFNWEEFEKFCRAHPQLVRRLRKGILRANKQEQSRQFVCPNPPDVVHFLADNVHVPSLFMEEPNARPGAWQPKDDKRRLLSDPDRFPLLPPRQDNPFLYSPDDSPLNAESVLGDDVDAYSVAGSWFCYSLKAVPPPGELPGEDSPITNRAQQRRPHMTSLLFRAYPFHMRRYTCERLQEEGWFDGKGWIIPGWFEPVGNRFRQPVNVNDARPLIGQGSAQNSRDAWERALKATTRYGVDNHILFSDDSASQQLQEREWQRDAEKFKKTHSPRQMQELFHMTKADLDALPLSEEEHRIRWAARYMADYDYYRNLGSFPKHLVRTQVESKEVTVLARKQFHDANSLYLDGEAVAALKTFEKVLPELANLNALDAWREKVLDNREFRSNEWTQEDTLEIQLHYMRIRDHLTGVEMRKQVQSMAEVLPLVPPLSPPGKPKFFQGPIVEGPFDRPDPNGGPPYIAPLIRARVLERHHLIPVTPPPGMRPPQGMNPQGGETPAGARPGQRQSAPAPERGEP